MILLITGAVALVLILSFILVSCNKFINSRRVSYRERTAMAAGLSSRSIGSSRGELTSEDYKVEPTQMEEIRTADSLRLPMNVRRRTSIATRKGKKVESSSCTDVIVVPLGKAQKAVVTRSNLTKRNRRKRDQSIASKKDSHKKVRFRDENRKKTTEEKTLPANNQEPHCIREEDVSEKSSPSEMERKSIGSI
ncbi:hypothetical protein Y032_0054g2509 [Ancylostoma ceylanicum]|uniref:Uncharacterized protein n=2 Tax=Ancylostoma ceylanicum TaxID=53326 RepID=A0A016U6B4_9BILA|nr:hypothetical protein Y032_0054g2509 [Ancylostoma ceylanicum]